jgi:putative inorganic carbon (hco3(-)) transporter
MNRDRFSPPRERLTFNDRIGSVPKRGYRDTVEDAPVTFADAPQAEPRDWGYFGLLAFTAVLLLRPQDQLPALAILRPAEICAFIGIAPMVLHRLSHRLPVFRITPETFGLMLFGAVILATAPFSIWPGGAFHEFFDSYFKVVIVFVLMMNTLTTTKRLERLMWLVVLCIGYIAALALANYARGLNLVENGRLAGPVSGIFGNPNDLALNMVSFLPAAIVIAISRRQSAAKRLVAAGIVVLMTATVVLTKSRGGTLGLVSMLVALVWLGGRARRGLGVAIVAAAVLAVPFLPEAFWSRMSSMVDEQQDKTQFTGSSEARRVVMMEGVDAFLEHPFTGVGAGQFKNYNPPERQERWREAHNVLIQVASETGIAGLLIFTFLLARAVMAAAETRRILRSRKGVAGRVPLERDEREALHDHAIAMSAGLFGWFVCAMFASVAYSWTFYYLLAMTVTARELARGRARAARPSAAAAA